MESCIIEMEVMNSPTILQRVIQIIKRRRINIRQLIVWERDEDSGAIKIWVEADQESVRLLKSQFNKQVDVISVYP
jgi:acetolactate synthase small subunit